jgi:hypothetical protein
MERRCGLVLPLAEQGNVDAQARLAFLYANGEGVTQDYAAALGALWGGRAHAFAVAAARAEGAGVGEVGACDLD